MAQPFALRPRYSHPFPATQPLTWSLSVFVRVHRGAFWYKVGHVKALEDRTARIGSALWIWAARADPSAPYPRVQRLSLCRDLSNILRLRLNSEATSHSLYLLQRNTKGISVPTLS